MIYEFSEYLAIDDGVSYDTLFSNFQIFNIGDLNNTNYFFNNLNNSFSFSPYFDENVKIRIQNEWYNVVPVSKLVRTESKDGYFRAIYIQINYYSGEYYIGKVNAANRKKLLSYSGSGVKFKAKYEKHKEQFVRYYICQCNTSEETEMMEAKIVNSSLLNDPFCLNLIQGGGKGTSIDYSEERKQKQSEYMKSHPERYKAMMEAVGNFTLLDIQRRGESIKKTMSDEKYKKMMSNRIKNWMKNNPEAYAVAREKNQKALSSPETREKRLKNRKKWKEEHQEEFAVWEEHRKAALATPESRKKRGNSQKEWIKNHPEESKKRSINAHNALKEKMAKPVEMVDITTKNVIRSFPSVKDAGDWLIENGYTKGKNPSSTISAVCRGKHIEGHGIKKSYLGFGWKYK